jgi:hypothetical protein
MGTFIVMNMTKSQAVNNVSFAMAGRAYNIATVTSGGTEIPAVRTRDQQSIALGQGSWETVVTYTQNGTPVQTRTVNSLVIPLNDPQAFRTNYLYFYRVKNGGYDISHVWPPVPNDADEKDNSEVLGPNQGILEVINRSRSDTVVRGIKVGSTVRMEYPDYLYPDNTIRFAVGAGLAQVSFLTDKSGGDYGQDNPVQIRAGEVTTLTYYDSLGQPDAYPPGGGLIRVENLSRSKVYAVMVTDPGSLTNNIRFNSDVFKPSGIIGYSSIGRIVVEHLAGTAPLETGKQYWIDVYLMTDIKGLPVVIRFSKVIKDTIADIRITQQHVDAWEGVNGNVRIVNNSNREVTGAYVYDQGQTQYGQTYSYREFRPAARIRQNGSGEFTVNNTQYLPLADTSRYNVHVYLERAGGGEPVVITKTNGGTGYILYNNSVTITVSQADVDGVSYIPVYEIRNVNPIVDRAALPHGINGTAAAQAAGETPTAVAAGEKILWRFDTADAESANAVSVSGAGITGTARSYGGQSWYENPAGISATGNTPAGKAIKLIGLVPKGTDASTDYSQTFRVTVVDTTPVTETITSVAGQPVFLYPGDSFDVRNMTVRTVNAGGIVGQQGTLVYSQTSPYWRIENAGSTAALSGGNLTVSSSSGTGTIRLYLDTNNWGGWHDYVAIEVRQKPAGFVPVTDITFNVTELKYGQTTTVQWTVHPANATNKTPVLMYGGNTQGAETFRVSNVVDNGNGTGTVDIFVNAALANPGNSYSLSYGKKLNVSGIVKKGKGNSDISSFQYWLYQTLQDMLPKDGSCPNQGLGDPFIKVTTFTLVN